MLVSKLLLFINLCLFWHFQIIPATNIPTSFDNLAISCGSSGSSKASDGRLWIGDSGFSSTLPLQINGKTSSSRAIHHPYTTARLSRHEFSYVFRVTPGQKFIRLHFYQDSYKGFKRSKAMFTVKAGPYTLLTNFSIPQNSDVIITAKHIIKEYCINVDDRQTLTITFSSAQRNKKSDDFFAFVNGIEVVSMPTGLYFSPERGLGALVVGHKYRFFIDNKTALELVQRLNVGGGSISPVEDSMMLRRWEDDSDYLSETNALTVINSSTTVAHSHTSTSVAPIQVYQTARIMAADTKLSTSNLTWNIPVDLGFRYLVRLHFSEASSVFSIVINDQVAEKNGDVTDYRDYIVMMEGDKMAGKRFLTITYQHKTKPGDDKFLVPLSALEVFKLSNPDNNLAGTQQVSELRQHKKAKSSYSINLISAVVAVILALLNVAVYHIARFVDPNFQRSISVEGPCRRFSIDEIRRSTNCFDPQFHIGSGGYGRVYKGIIDYEDTVVAIKRKKTESKQGETEFRTEIKMLPKVRHENLVSLIGYCNDGAERMLIYQYMTRGTLSDHLYNTRRNGNSISNPPLSWERRLKVSIGAARGLYYLHSRHRIIHRDVKSSNILLDENWVAKISDFGLSKMGPTNDSVTHISTNVRGTYGYLDPEYSLTGRLTKKSDVYAFGVVLFEVLSGRPAVSLRVDDEQHILAGWARYCIREAKADRLIDHNLAGQISHASLKVFVGIAGRCLQTTPQGRPAMADVVMALELALALQQTTDPTEVTEQVEEEENEKITYSDQNDVVKVDSDRIISEDNPRSSTRNRGSDKKNGKYKAKDSISNNSIRWWDPQGLFPRSTSKSRPSQQLLQVLVHQFSLNEIHIATNNFHNSLIIGYGGLDSVYKGYIDGGKKVVAIRWSRAAESRQSMARELQSKKEIQMKLSPTPDNVAFLVGYCETESDMILVYNHMANGALYDHLHEASKEPLPWRRRLQICIGAARGLSFILSNIKQTILHLELKSTNIWLDEEWIPKVSEWGLTKKRGNNLVPTILKSKWGIHLDSAYIWEEQITEKSYVFSFGLILFEVLFAEKESGRWLYEDQVSLAEWIKLSMMTDLSGCIDPFLAGRTSPDSLKTFIETAERCLLEYGTDRPSMNDAVTRLEEALKQQDAARCRRS